MYTLLSFTHSNKPIATIFVSVPLVKGIEPTRHHGNLLLPLTLLYPPQNLNHFSLSLPRYILDILHTTDAESVPFLSVLVFHVEFVARSPCTTSLLLLAFAVFS